MQIAIVGCGYVACYYFTTLPLYENLHVLGVVDRDQPRANAIARRFSTRAYDSLDQMLGDNRVDLVVNLTNPRNHFSVSRACLEAGKHVYSEKPLALTYGEAKHLTDLAARRKLLISTAPSRILGETAQTLWKALRDDAVGQPYLTYAEMEDGMVHRMPYRSWKNELGVPWPYKDDFETGCTLEHGGYVVSLLAMLFGPVETVTAVSSVRIQDKETPVTLEPVAPDFSVACLRFASGHLARLTFGIIAPRDRSIRIFGSDGTLYTKDINRPRSRVYIQSTRNIRRRAILVPWMKQYPLATPPRKIARARSRLLANKKIDFCLGISEMVDALQQERRCRLSPEFCLHHAEVVIAIHNAVNSGSMYTVRTTFEQPDPMPWAQSP